MKKPEPSSTEIGVTMNLGNTKQKGHKKERFDIKRCFQDEHQREDYDRCMKYLEDFLSRLSGAPSDMKRLRTILGDLSLSRDGTGSLFTLLPYDEYLKTHHWQGMRKREVLYAGYRCRLCNAGDCELHVHHRTYERLGRERPGDVLCLCDSCHAAFHEKTAQPAEA